MSILNLPHAFDLVVGDTFEMFYRGILKCVNPSVYDLEFTWQSGAQSGAAYRRKFVFTPTEEDIGTRALLVTLRDNTGAILEQKMVDMRVWNKPQSPKEERVVLCMGASTTGPGVWPSELNRRLTGEGGTPEGHGLKNIRLIGSVDRRGVRFEGYGGWHFKAYSTAHTDARFIYIYGDFSDKDEIGDQHSFYSDDIGGTWKLESIQPDRIKLIRTAWGGTIPPAPGVLHHESGGTNHADIVYNEATRAEANPFWDVKFERNNFRAYAEKMGVDHIDEVLIYLGGNSSNTTEYVYKQQVRTFLDGLFAEFPNCKVTLAGMNVPGRDGMGHNYGITWKWHEKVNFVFNLAKWYMDIAEESAYRGRVEFMSLSAQFDTDNMLPTQSLPVNTRSTKTEIVNTNALHPTEEGYFQIADAFYRRMVSHLQGEE